MERLTSFFGLLCMVAIAFGLSSDRKNINWRTVGSGIALQLTLGLLILKTSGGQAVFEGARTFFT
jgi:CNT family concentrative nucleoside transporter